MTKYIVLEDYGDEENLSFIGFADNYVQASTLAHARLDEAKDIVIYESENKNTTIESCEVKVINMYDHHGNFTGYKLLQLLDVSYTAKDESTIRYTLVKKIYLLVYDEDVKTSTSTGAINSSEFQLDMFTYMKGGYEDGNN